MKLSRRKMELMLVDIAIIICVYYMTNLVKVLRLHSIVLNGEINLSRMLALVVTIMAGRIVFGVYRNIWRYANIQTYLTIMVSDFVSNVLLMLLGRVWFAVNLGIGVHLIVAMAILLVTLLSRYCYQLLYAIAIEMPIRILRATPSASCIRWRWPSWAPVMWAQLFRMNSSAIPAPGMSRCAL